MISVQNLILFLLFVQSLNSVEIDKIDLNMTNNLLIIGQHELTIHQNEMSTEMTANIVAHSVSVLKSASDGEKQARTSKCLWRRNSMEHGW